MSRTQTGERRKVAEGGARQANEGGGGGGAADGLRVLWFFGFFGSVEDVSNGIKAATPLPLPFRFIHAEHLFGFPHFFHSRSLPLPRANLSKMAAARLRRAKDRAEPEQKRNPVGAGFRYFVGRSASAVVASRRRPHSLSCAGKGQGSAPPFSISMTCREL